MLAPAGLSETVTVTASRVEQRTGDIPASVSVLGRETIRQSPAVVADDVLRQVPTFSLFRRTSSLASHPTTQGVSLRGIGPSGVSRYARAPRRDSVQRSIRRLGVLDASATRSVDRIEAVEGTASSLYGNYAMGGVINISSPRRRRDERSRCGRSTAAATARRSMLPGSDVWGAVRVSADVSAFSTDGYPPVVASERGLVDTKATVDFTNVNAKLQYDPTSRVQAFVRGGYFREDRDNGKVSTIDGTEEANDTKWTSASGGVRLQLPDRPSASGQRVHRRDAAAQQFSRGAGGHAAAQHRPDDAEPDSAGELGGCRRAVVAGVCARTISSPPEGLAVGGRRQPRGRPRPADRHAGHPETALRRHAAQPRRVRAGRDHADRAT